MSPRKRRFTEKLASWYLWHRYIGLAAALLAAWLAVTGILLNHTEDLELPEKHVTSDTLLSIYNVRAPQELDGLQVRGHWIVPTPERIYIDTLAVETGSRFVTALPAEFGFIIVLAEAIQLYTAEAVLIEEIPFTAGRGKLVAAMPKDGGGFWFSTGARAFAADAGVVSIQPSTGTPEFESPALQAVPDKLAARIGEHLRKHTVTQERLLLDLHSGRLFGIAGVWVADAVGIALLLLAISGVSVWLNRARSRRRHRQN